MVAFTKTYVFLVTSVHGMVLIGDAFEVLTAAVDGELATQASGLFATAMGGLNSILDVAATLIGAAV